LKVGKNLGKIPDSFSQRSDPLSTARGCSPECSKEGGGGRGVKIKRRLREWCHFGRKDN